MRDRSCETQRGRDQLRVRTELGSCLQSRWISAASQTAPLARPAIERTLNCWRRLPARSATTRRRSATGRRHFARPKRQLRVQQQARNRRLELGFDGCRGGAAGHGLLAFAAMQRRTNLADQARRSRDGEVDLQRNGQAGVLADAVGGGRIALGQSLVDHDAEKLAFAQRGQRRSAALRPLQLPCPVASPTTAAQLRAPSIPVTKRMLMFGLPVAAALSCQLSAFSGRHL